MSKIELTAEQFSSLDMLIKKRENNDVDLDGRVAIVVAKAVTACNDATLYVTGCRFTEKFKIKANDTAGTTPKDLAFVATYNDAVPTAQQVTFQVIGVNEFAQIGISNQPDLDDLSNEELTVIAKNLPLDELIELRNKAIVV
ncbi:hypothetical protein [Pedobacter frigoris]|uniref:Uncharacterized protein n=1 Tax=Pedobacter frigoris TaxID=2571272 RepID=A0A4V5NZ98_9SPHI|nr:hypothetical protein [Pedobacter frigoris]TKC06223.1 hypothetical protein FA047_12945 [Pedobacter frigoris]